jgi:2-haloacid dehalogenase
MSTVVFDLNGTLTQTAALAEPWQGAAPPRFGAEVLDEAVQMSMVDTLTGTFRRFPDLLHGALVRRAQLSGLSLEPVPAAMAAAACLPPRPEARAALDHLHAAGLRVAVLTNSAAVAGRHTLDAAGLLDLIDRLDGADAVRAYKPHPSAYALTVKPERSWFVAAHWWDVTGAARAGFSTAWVSADDVVLPETAVTPDVVAPDLLTAAREITALTHT